MSVNTRLRRVAPNWLRSYVRRLRSRAASARVRLRAKRPCQRLAPSFLIVGAAKAGTTSLFRYLTQHPRIVEPLRKEIDYFSHEWNHSLDWYLAHFPRVDGVSPGVITGEASPSYLVNRESPARVAGVLGDVKIIVLLRDPVARAISHYQHDIRNKVRKRRDLVEYLVVEGMELRPDLTGQLIADLRWAGRPMDPPPGELWPPIYIRQGLYADQLSNWWRYFDRDRTLIVKAEDLFRNPQAVYAQTLTFLDLPYCDPGPMEALNAGRYEDADPVVMRYLSDVYANPNRRLHDLLGGDFPLDWPGVDPTAAGQ